MRAEKGKTVQKTLDQQSQENAVDGNSNLENRDEIVFSQLQFRCQSKLLKMLSNILSEAEAQEVAQDALLKVFLLAKQDPSSSTLNARINQLDPLLFTIAKNMALSKVRHKQVREAYIRDKKMNIDTEIVDSLENSLEKEKDQQLLISAIEQLPLICKKIFIERKLQGKSHAEIAKQYNISKKTVENHITKGLKLCKQFIQSKQQTTTCKSFKKPSHKFGRGA